MDYRIPVEAPTGLYYLQFKHLRGSITIDSKGEPEYVSGSVAFTDTEVVKILMASTSPLPTPMTKGHTLASAAYVMHVDSDSSSGTIFDGTGVAILAGLNHKVTKHQLRRAALTEAVAELPAVDRAYFHLVLSEMEGKPLEPILRGILHDRPTDREALLRHLVGLGDDTIPMYRKYYNWIPSTGRMQVFNRERDE